ncbi:MAG: obg [Chlamydiales bacterium]|jgi:GTP-binding protein|nr:obg [Chlamydiales bacterium]
MFLDRVVIKVKAGKGGNGVVSWRREKYLPKGGPDGGNGSKGGDVIFEADDQVLALDTYRNNRIRSAENGKPGEANLRQGRQGKDLVLKVPCGTLIKNATTGDVLADFTENKQRLVICRGGRGGRGNASFKTPTNQTPNYATPGKDGEEADIELELKLIADIGLVGYPNAGKSTLISSIAHIEVKIAPYPFTTLQPNLGYIQFENYKKVLIADIPGIIEGASENRGLGFEFLRHIERTKGLLYVIDAAGMDGRSPIDDFKVLRNELEKYNPELLNKPYAVVLNKMDLEEAQSNAEEFKKEYPFLEKENKLFAISAVNKEGMGSLSGSLYLMTYVYSKL